MLDIRNIADEILSRGKQYHNKVVEQRALSADEAVAIKLGVMVGSPVFYSEIIHYANDIPMQLEVRWVNSRSVPHYLIKIYPNYAQPIFVAKLSTERD